MAVERKHEIIEIDKKEDLANSYFMRRGIIYSRDCDNNTLNVWIEGTLFENLEIFYHCENETESTPDKAFDLFEVGRKVLVLHKIIYNEEENHKIEKIERMVIGLKYNSPEGIDNLQPCIVKRFFAKVGKVTKDPITGDPIISYSYHWIYINDGDERKVTVIEINDNEDKTETEVFHDAGFFSELERVLYLGEVEENPYIYPLTQSATKSFMMTNDSDFRERWVATPCSLFKDQCEVINIMYQRWTVPPPCDEQDMVCPPNRFYCDIEKRILVWYGAYEKFVGATIVRFDNDTAYTWNSVAASGVSIADPDGLGGYLTLADTEWDIPLNMISGVNWVSKNEISFYLPFGANRRPGQVTIDWINYSWFNEPVNSGITDETEHWYWSAEGFEQKVCAQLKQENVCDGFEYEREDYSYEYCECDQIYPSLTEAQCEACGQIKQTVGMYELNVDRCDGYTSNYKIELFDKTFDADTLYRSVDLDELKRYDAHECVWVGNQCYYHTVWGYTCAKRGIGERIKQKNAEGLSAVWQSNNVAYYSKEKDRDECDASAAQSGKVCTSWTQAECIPWGGVDYGDFDKCHWPCDPDHLCAESCPGGIGSCFKIDMPGDDWNVTGTDRIENNSGSPTWYRETNTSSYEEPLIQKLKLDDIEFDATEVYKTYYLDDRATCHEQGLVIAGKGVRMVNEKPVYFWEVYHDGVDITEKLFEALGCEQSELDEIGLI